jgi:hypothetical protein
MPSSNKSHESSTSWSSYFMVFLFGVGAIFFLKNHIVGEKKQVRYESNDVFKRQGINRPQEYVSSIRRPNGVLSSRNSFNSANLSQSGISSQGNFPQNQQ